MSELRDENDPVERTAQAPKRDNEQQAAHGNLSMAQMWDLLEQQKKRADKAIEQEKKRADKAIELEKKRADKAEEKADKEKVRADENERDLCNLSLENYLKKPLEMARSEDCKPSIKPNEEARKIVQNYRIDMRKYRTDMQEWTKVTQEQQNNKRPKTENPQTSENRNPRAAKMTKKPEMPVRYKFHDPAKIHKWQVGPWLSQVKLNFRDGRGKFVNHSFVNINLTNGKLPLFNETDPQDYLKLCLQDIIKCSGLPADVVKEASLFSVRPDLLVVMYEGIVVFAIEIKNPDIGSQGKTQESVFESETAAGQVYVYLHVLKQSGMDLPFALLSTYNGTVVVRLADQECNEGYEGILDGVAGQVDSIASARHKQNCAEQNAEQNPETPGKQTIKKPMSTYSPAPKDSLLFSENKKLLSLAGGFAVNKRPAGGKPDPGVGGDQTEYSEEEDDEVEEEDDQVEDDNGEFDYQGREVAYSEILTIENIHRLLALVLESSISSIQNGQRRKLVPDPFSDLEGRYCVLREDSFNFAKLARCDANYNQAPRFTKNQMIFVHCTVGEGGHRRCILCSTSSGLMFVAKLFLTKRHPTNYDAVERDKFYDQQYAEKYKGAAEELERWRTVNPHCAQYLKKVLKLHGLPAVPMPYFPPIPMADRENALPKIEECLIKVADKGFYYDDEVRWRHFGLRWAGHDMEITALDLGSLQPLKEIVLQHDLLTWICDGMLATGGELTRLHKRLDELLPDSAEDTRNAVNLLRNMGKDNETNDPAGKFRNIIASLAPKYQNSLLNLAREIEAVRGQMKQLHDRRQEPIGKPKVSIPRART